MKKTILVSACLTGIPCRYDGKSKPLAALNDLSSEEFTILPVCPECGCEWPVPRPPIRVETAPSGEKRLIRICDHRDLSCTMNDFSHRFLARNDFFGWIGQDRSPSCGLANTPLWRNGTQSGTTDGFFSAAVRATGKPIIGAADFSDGAGREQFLQALQP